MINEGFEMKKLLSLILCLLLSLPIGTALADFDLTPEQVTEKILSLQADYPDQQLWSKDIYYAWRGGIYEGGKGGMAFLFMASDAIFGDLPARMVQPVDYGALRPGDLLRVKNNTHSVMVVEVLENHITVVEVSTDRKGNSRIYWGRTLSKSAVLEGDYVLARYPGGGGTPGVLPGDVNADGAVDGRDAVRLARYIATKDAEASARAADVNDDGDIDGKDLRLLVQYLSGQDVELKVRSE